MMTPATTIRSLLDHVGEEVTLRGWLLGKRSGGKVVFLLVRDGTGTAQCVVEAKLTEAFEAAQAVTQESSLAVRGTVRADDRAPGGCELSVTGMRVLQHAEDYPVSRKAHGADFLFQHRHLWLRSPRQATLMRIRHTLIRAIRSFFDGQGFTLVDTPLLVPGAAEGAGTLFPVEYFGEEAYLAQTGQLYLESACMALGKVYCFGPTFRAEKSKTRRHLTEFWMVEPEVAFAELPDLMDLAEAFICHLVAEVLKAHRTDLATLDRDVAPLAEITPGFPRLTYSEAVEILRDPATEENLLEELEQERARLRSLVGALEQKEQEAAAARKPWQQDKLARDVHELRERIHDVEEDVRNRPGHIEQARNFAWGKDLGGAEETILSRTFDKPLIITEYPKAAKAFYMKRSAANPDVVLNLDVLAPEGYGEIVGGSQREDDHEQLLRRIEEEGMETGPYEWYLDLRRYGSVPHGGFGLGVERTLAWMCGLRHVRETIAFPRTMGRMTP
jgi:asparaginyl-tRNA synthetase